MNIIGAGLTGCLAAYAFKDAVIHEYLKAPKVHKAVLRFRSDAVSQLTGIPFKKVLVSKAVSSGGKFVSPDIRLLNQYSLKVTGGYYDRSIGNLEPVVRYIAPKDFHAQMLEHLGNRIICCSNKELVDFDTPLISTLPLPVLIKMFGLDAQLPSEATAHASIFVTTVDYKHCDLYQTVYFPDLETPVYRASVTGNQLIIESMAAIDATQLMEVQDVFGLPNRIATTSNSNMEQRIGKFTPLEETYRKQLMYDITQSLGIYSLGRHATWRKIVLDDVVGDIYRIESMLKTSAYDRMLGKAK